MSDDDISLRISTPVFNANAPAGGDSFFKVDPRTIDGWEDIRVTRGIERMPSSFDIELTEPRKEVSEIIAQPGDYVEVFLGSDKVLTGFIDQYNPAYSAGGHRVRISGRSRCQDIVDCSIFPAGFEAKTETLLSIAQRLASPYGISVALAHGADQGAVFPAVVTCVGETPFELLDRLCKTRSLLFYDNADGNLVISPVGSTQAAGGLVEGVNVLSAQAAYSQHMRYRQYDAFPTSLDIFKDTGNISWQVGQAIDNSIQRFRYRGIANEVFIDGQSLAAQLAEWELGRRFGRSFCVYVETDSWRDSAGNLYEPNTLVKLDLPGLKLPPATWLISSVEYKLSEAGTTCELQIMPPDAFKPQPSPYLPIATDTLAN